MKKSICYCLIGLLVACQSSPRSASVTNKWVQLFNGKDLTGWTPKISGYPAGENYANTFRVENGLLKVVYDGYAGFDDKFGHLFYKDKYSYYVLGLEYRFTGDQVAGGPGWAYRNSGAMLHSQSAGSMTVTQDFPISIEMQLLGGNGKDERHTANLCTPGTNVVMNGKLFTDHCINSNSKTYHGDQWVRVDVLVLGDSLIKHIIDGQSVLSYEKPQVGGGNVSNYDPAVKKDGELLREGYISLQSESHPIEFRKVEILDLSAFADDNRKLQSILDQLKLK